MSGGDNAARAVPRWRRIGRVVGRASLTVAAVVGLLCIVAVPGALLFRVSLIMFSTGSMAPTIPAGSVALIREVPADEVAVGDVVTVQRPGMLPVTHRTVRVEPGPGDSRFLVLRGDANVEADAEPYQVTTVGLVLFSIPRVAKVIVAMSSPVVLGVLTVAAAGLVLWAFWPRRASTVAGGAVILLVMIGLTQLPGAAPPAAADERERIVSGQVITLVAVGDDTAMTSLRPGEPVHWQVGVLSEPPEPGRISVSMAISGSLSERHDGLDVSIAGCAERWREGQCRTGSEGIIGRTRAADLRGAAHALGSIPAGQPRWLQVTVWLGPGDFEAGGDATVQILAEGFGDAVSTQPPLPNTGATASARIVLLAGSLAALLGCALVMAGRRRGSAG